MFKGFSYSWWCDRVDCDFQTGVIRWKARPITDFCGSMPDRDFRSWNTAFSGKVVGSIVKTRGKSYKRSSIFGIRFSVHQLIYYMYHKSIDTSLVINHINGDSLDNSITNLEQITQSLNNRSNVAKRSDNTTGFKGVTYSKKLNKYIVRCQINGKRLYGGVFSNIEDAKNKYTQFSGGR